MSREIKFRMWGGKKMFYDLSNVMECLKQQMAYDYNDNSIPRYDHVGEGSAFMRYTGLKDKNGKEIYEGDIVRVYDEEIIKVEFKNAFWLLEEFISEGYLGGFGTPTESGHKPLYRYQNWNIEIIGNIYDNPDLLK